MKAMQSWMRLWRTAAQSLIAVLVIAVGGTAALAQAAGSPHTPVVVSQFDASSTPYHFTWAGTTGVFQRDALGNINAATYKMTYLHMDPGPRGYAKYLAWYLARNADSFVLLWCYLNDSGTDFYTWVYSYPSNQLTSLHFTGKYTFSPPAEPTPPSTDSAFTARAVPHYAGPEFAYRDWRRAGGTLAKLELRPTTGSVPAASASAPVAKTLTGLMAVPLQEVHVASGNGWRTSGWRELHCLAQDSSGDPYYLILYSNATRGFVIDLKRAQTFVTDFGQTVAFNTAMSVFGAAEDRMTGPPELKIGRFARHEVEFTATGSYDNPYSQCDLAVIFRAPTGVEVTVHGFWDGGSSWIVRFAPDTDGPWTWRSRSQDAGLDGQQGSFTCVSQSDTLRGFVRVAADNRRHFSYADGSPFLPVTVQYPVQGLAHAMSASGVASDTVDLDPGFKRDTDVLAGLGFNRLLGGGLITAAGSRNEGGDLFPGRDPNRINPAFFDALDRRIAYCNSKGIVPDLGIGTINADLYGRINDEQMLRLWQYVVSRYSAFNVCWNLFDREIGSRLPDQARATIASLVTLTGQEDPEKHPVTLVVPGSATPIPPQILTPSDGGQSSSTPFVSSPAGMRLFPDASGLIAQRTATVELAETTTPAADIAGLDVITLNGGDLQEITADYNFDRPIVIYDRSVPPSAEAARHRIWETWMRGGCWARDSGDDVSAQAPGTTGGNDEIHWAAYCGKLFGMTRYWRVTPHNELAHALPAGNTIPAVRTGPVVASASSVTGADPPSGRSATSPEHPVFVLAETGWEYIVYFEHGGDVNLDLLEATGDINAVWFNPRTGTALPTDRMKGGSIHAFHAPDDNDWVLYLTRR